MNNEQIVSLIQQGEQALYTELYEQNSGLIFTIARQYEQVDSKAVDFDDLMQTGFLALVAATEHYDPSQGMAFSSYAVNWIRSLMRQAVGLSGAKKAHNGALSLNEPLSDESDAGERGDLLEDARATAQFEDIDQADMQRVVRQCVDGLPQVEQREVVAMRHFNGLEWAEIARNLDITMWHARDSLSKAFALLRRNKAMCELAGIYGYDRTYRHKGLKAFKSSFSSEVEDHVIWQEERLNRIREWLAKGAAN